MKKTVISNAINTYVVDKTKDYRTLNFKFKNFSSTPEELLDHITAGHAWCTSMLSENVNGFCHRSEESFICGQVIGVDIDNKLGNMQLSLEDGYWSYEDAIADINLISEVSFIYTTPSYTDEHNRFRIVFVLEEPIEEKEAFKKIIRHFTNKYNGDSATTSASQTFFGSTNCQSNYFGNIISAKQVQNILEIERDAQTHTYLSSNHTAQLQDDNSILTTSNYNNFERKDLEEMISFIFKSGSTENDIWFKTVSILKNHTELSDDSIKEIISKHVELGDIDTKLMYANRYNKLKLGTLVYFAVQNGYVIPHHIKYKNATFWNINKENKEAKTTLHYTTLNNFLVAHGFKKYRDQFIRIENMIIEEVSKEEIKKFIFEYIHTATNVTKEDKILVEEKIRKSSKTLFNAIFSDLDFVNKEDINTISQDTHDTVYLYYKNGIVKITPYHLELLPYCKLNNYIWSNQIIQRDFIEADDNTAEIEQYITDVCTVYRSGILDLPDFERVKLLKKSIGYLISGYKDPTNSVAIILTDEEISENPQGRTGKSLLGQMLKQITKVADVDGRRLNLENQFSFSTVNPFDNIIFLDDCNKNFDLTKLFHVITGGLTIEKKGKDSIKLSFENTPKLLLTTNNLINLTGRSSTERVVEIEFSDYYVHKKPLEKFGHRLVSDWDTLEWRRFDNSIIKYIQLFLREGLQQKSISNRKIKTILSLIGNPLLDFCNQNIEINTAYPTAKFKERFEQDEELDSSETMSKTAFTQALRKYSEVYLELNFVTAIKNNVKHFVITDKTRYKFSAFETSKKFCSK